MSYWTAWWKLYKVNMFILGVIASIASIVFFVKITEEDPA